MTLVPGQSGADHIVGGGIAELPVELREAVSCLPTAHETPVDGRTVSWLSWGDPACRPLVLVHGGAAHGWWWSFTAALLAERYHVIAPDLSGHGDSSPRPAYSFHGWVDEVEAVLDEQPCHLPPVVLGHSMGGIVASLLASRRDRPLAGLIVVDAPLSTAGARHFDANNALLGRRRCYDSQDAAVARFRLVPEQHVLSGFLLEHVARHSVRLDAESKSWTWKFDDTVFAEHPGDRPNDLWHLLDALSCPAGIIVATGSDIVADVDRRRLENPGVLGRANAGFLCRFLPGGHHLMFDRPVELIDTVRDFLHSWLGHENPAEA